MGQADQVNGKLPTANITYKRMRGDIPDALKTLKRYGQEDLADMLGMTNAEK